MSRAASKSDPRPLTFLAIWIALALSLGSCQLFSGRKSEENRKSLLQAHRLILQAHLDADVDRWLAIESDEFTLVNRGAITFPTPEERRARRAPYLAATRFEFYRDLRPPRVELSEDGTLGWLIAQVEVKGTQLLQDGSKQPLQGTWAWIELYRREETGWKLVGNVSNAKP